MTREEYKELQELFTKKINQCEYLSGNKSGAYREGVLACKSILKTVYEESNKRHEADKYYGGNY